MVIMIIMLIMSKGVNDGEDYYFLLFFFKVKIHLTFGQIYNAILNTGFVPFQLEIDN